MFIAALFTIVKTRKQAKSPSTDEWIKKMWGVCVFIYINILRKNPNFLANPIYILYIYTHVYICKGILLRHKKE